ncbi:glutamine-hydrolyzing GMP synthase [Thermoflavifilum thermophilum]|uniref:GMP synthase [glutamine-hydrolyzing] n=1 Tax=Thermoflavifilum thermophilum TaxID=1393122 RepID=A0A1I7N2Q5_9BACT|nr:glutamine-hydrolyzing GMP synthase [Thermoflavifilum thermophilum]SFV28836.1 GMP synthase (glutamine-hydrolysing) [Thermoflavifilum thermophilum]
MQEKILIVDFGSQYTQLIARTVRECQVYAEIVPCNRSFDIDSSVKGIILSGSPFSVNDPGSPHPPVQAWARQRPVLGICYGAQLIAQLWGGTVARSQHREYGRAMLQVTAQDPLWQGMSPASQVWMSHADTIVQLPEGFESIATTEQIPVAAFRAQQGPHPLYGLQFHPEVIHSVEGKTVIWNFLFQICGCQGLWTPESFIEETVQRIQHQVGEDEVIMALSGGVDSTVAAVLIHRAIGHRLHGIFVNHGLLRLHEFEQVMEAYRAMGLDVKGVDASEIFYRQLKGITDPEEKRKRIGKTFIDVFQHEAKAFPQAHFLGQGTIYPDVIESVSVNGPSVTIKSHHNVGGLPEKMHLQLVEPLRMLFKDEVRRVGETLGVHPDILHRHPFPGPGLAIRILGEVTPEKVALLQQADAIFIEQLREKGLYDEVWQAGAILLPVQSVGVMGDERTYEYVVALRAVTSRDGMTADWARLPDSFLAEVSNAIINRVKGINRVVYDISSKPPATIEWE